MHITIHDLPKIEKPREKLLRYGASKLRNEELLAILLRTGKKGKNVIQISREIISKFGSDLTDISIEKLSKIEGIGPAKACEIIACFELGKRFLHEKKSQIISSPEEIWNLLSDIRSARKEHFVAVFLDSRNQEIRREIISIGTINTSLVHPREVFEPAVKYLASHVILVHNHPSGATEPSEADIEVTKRLIYAGKILGIEIIDHIIVAEKQWYSFKEQGVMEFDE